MSLQTFLLQPTADVQLVLEPATQKSLQLQVKGFDDSVALTTPITSDCTFTIADASIATVNASGLLTAVKKGITFLTVKHKVKPLELVARVFVHQKIDAFHAGNKSGTVHLNSDDFQPTVYADFAGDVEDITGHPYLRYQSLTPATISVDATTGRVTGTATGTGKLRITDTSGTTIIDLDIEIKKAFAADRPIVERIDGKAGKPDRRNILFVAEGFSAAEESKFKKIAGSIDYRMRTSPVHEPFKLLHEDYTTWLAFEPSKESGITIGHVLDSFSAFFPDDVSPATTGNFSLHQLIDLVGIPTSRQMDSTYTKAVAITEWSGIPGFSGAKLEDFIFDSWKLAAAFSRNLHKNSAFGMMYGRRPGDRFARTPGTDKADNTWYRSHVRTDFFFKDIRRSASGLFPTNINVTGTPATRHWTKEFFDYFGALKRKGVAASDPGFAIGSKWGLDGDDQGLVIMIVNDVVNAGNYFNAPFCFGAVSVGQKESMAGAIDQVQAVEDHIPSTNKFDKEAITATAIHELCHGLSLGDEYENFRNSSKPSLLSTMAPELTDLELFHNLNSTTQIVLNGSKWENTFTRIEKSSAFLTDAITGTTAGTIEFTLFKNEAKKWSVGEDAVIISKNLNTEADFRFYPKYRQQIPSRTVVKITKITGDKLTVSSSTPLSATLVFPKGSMIFFPKMLSGSPLDIFLPGVMALLNNGKGLLSTTNLHIIDFTKVFSKKTTAACAVANTGLAATPFPIPHVDIARDQRHWLVGMHEGGGTYNCGVMRPSAVCKMRSEYLRNAHFRFCHVCKYAIVHEFNPSRHAELDNQYPGKPI